jgi:hypothetical protein
MRQRFQQAAVAMVLMIAPAAAAWAGELTHETRKAWDCYLQTVQDRVKERVEGQRPFLWLDEGSTRRQRARQGEILVWHPGAEGTQAVPNGLIHDWAGDLFIPGATIQDLFSVLHNYGRYGDYYRPVVQRAKLLGRDEENERYQMVWMKKALFVTAALEGEYETTYVPLDDKRWYSVSNSTRVQEIRNFGHTDEQKMAPDTGSGFLWRMYSSSRFEERDGGVYVEIEVVALSRDIPPGLRWLVTPYVAKLSRDSVISTLDQTREAVLQSTVDPPGPSLAAGR